MNTEKKKRRATITCLLIKCPACQFEQQTLEKNSVICCNENCKKEINVRENLLRIVNGGEGYLIKTFKEKI